MPILVQLTQALTTEKDIQSVDLEMYCQKKLIPIETINTELKSFNINEMKSSLWIQLCVPLLSQILTLTLNLTQTLNPNHT